MCSERISKYEFGIRLAEKFSLDKSIIKKDSMYNFKFFARRQPDLSLATYKYNNLFKYELPALDISLDFLRIKLLN